MRFIGEILGIETIAEGRSIRELADLRDRYGSGNWKKKKGITSVQLEDGSTARAEIHWYEAHGIGKVKMKVKRWL
jgi:hypothetical protein